MDLTRLHPPADLQKSALHLQKTPSTMKSAILATLIASATAFAPSATTRSSTQLNEFANGLVGGESVEPMPFRPDGPKNAANFDPAGFTEVRMLI